MEGARLRLSARADQEPKGGANHNSTITILTSGRAIQKFLLTLSESYGSEAASRVEVVMHHMDTPILLAVWQLGQATGLEVMRR